MIESIINNNNNNNNIASGNDVLVGVITMKETHLMSATTRDEEQGDEASSSSSSTSSSSSSSASESLEPARTSSISEEKVNETNVLFQHLPSYYIDEAEEEDEEDDDDENDSDEDDDDDEYEKAIMKQQTRPVTTTTGTTTTSIQATSKTTTTTTTTTTTSSKSSPIQSIQSRKDIIMATKRARMYYTSEYEKDMTINQVLPRLFISDDVTARNKPLLAKHKITHILNLTTNIPNKFEPDITYLKLVIFDFETQNIAQYFGESFEFIENALKQNESNRVLVHCNAGISRSASFVIAYLLQKRHFKSYRDAYSHLKKARPIIEPNRGFEKQLINFEKRMRKHHRGCSIM